MADARNGYRPILDQMWMLYPDLVDAGEATFAATHRKAGHLAHGWFMRCHRGLGAVLVLEKAGHSEEAAPIRRSVEEHVLALKWLAVEGEKVLDTVGLGHRRDVERRRDALLAADWTSVNLDELREIVSEIDELKLDDSGNTFLHYAHRRERYGSDHDLPGYLADVAKCHPSYESAVAYCQPTRAGLNLLPGPRVPDWPQVPFASTQLLDALLALRCSFDPQPWTTELRKALADYRAVTDAVRLQDGLVAIDWSTYPNV